MNSTHCSLRVDHARSRRSASGFALLGALFVIVGVAGVSLIALMSMTLTASRAYQSENETANDVRAADNALESAINMLRMDPNGELGRNDNCIDPGGVDFESNDRTVTVTANCEESTLSMPVNDSPSGTAPSVRLVGSEGYQSAPSWADTVRWDNDCLLGSSGLGSCGPWSLGIGSANYSSYAATEFAAAQPNLVHTADVDPANPDNEKTLKFAADVLSRHGSATMVPPSLAQPAAEVAGSYEQGDDGLFAPQGGVDCGVSQVGHPWNVIGAQIRDSDTASLGLPTCGSTAINALALDPRYEIENDSGVALRPSFGETFASFAPTPTCSAGVGGVIELPPGAYGKAQTAALNDLLGGNCPNRVFWFRSVNASTAGAYWFDVEDPTKPDGSAQVRDLWNSLIVSDPTVRVIFGTPTGGFNPSAAASATFPDACDPKAAGVEIELSPRTTIRQLGGKVSICDRSTEDSTSNVPAAIWQAGNADGGWRGVADPAQSQIAINQVNSDLIGWDPLGWLSDSATVTSPTNAWLVDGNVAYAKFTCQIIFSGTCAGDIEMKARGFAMPSAAAAPAGRLDRLDVLIKAKAQTNGGFNLTLFQNGAMGTEVKFFKAGASTASCGAYFPFLPDSKHGGLYMTLAVDLMSTTGQPITGIPKCNAAGLTRADLQGSGVDVTHRLSNNVSFGIYSNITNEIWIDGVELQAGWDLTPTGAIGGSGWNNAGNTLVTDGYHSGYTLGGCPFLGSCSTATRSVAVTGFDNTVRPHVPVDGSLEEAGVIVTGETTDQNFFTNGSFYDLSREPDISSGSWMRVTVSNLRDTPGGQCVAYWPRVPFWGQGVYLDLLDPSVAGTCNTVLTNSEQLIGASAVLEVHVARNSWGANVDYGTRIDSVRLSTVTSGQYTKPRSPAVMTIGDGPSDDSSFNIFGQVSMPRNDLNVRWNGPAPTDDSGEPVAIGGGNMILASLGSYVAPGGEAGVICCSPTKPAERIVELTATVPDSGGPRVVGTARVVINDVGGPGSGLRVEDWSLDEA